MSSDDPKEAAAQVKNCDGYFTDSDPRRQGVIYASTVAMANRIRVAQNHVVHSGRNPVYHQFLLRVSRGLLTPAALSNLRRRDEIRNKRLYSDIPEQERPRAEIDAHNPALPLGRDA